MLALVALVLAAPGAHAGSRPSEADLETLLVCPTCHETLDESTSPVAQQMKAEIRRRIAQGWSKQQILDEMVANFGPGVLSTPATHGFDLLAWLLPLGGIALAAVALGGGAWYWTRARDEESAKVVVHDDHLVQDHLDPELERRVDEELARFDA